MDVVWYQPSRGACIVSITKQGLGFNKAAAEAMGMPEYIKLGYVPEQKYIVAKPVDGPEEAFRFAPRLRAGWIKVNNRGFVREVLGNLKIDLDRARRYLARWDAGEGVLVIDLNELAGEGRNAR